MIDIRTRIDPSRSRSVDGGTSKYSSGLVLETNRTSTVSIMNCGEARLTWRKREHSQYDVLLQGHRDLSTTEVWRWSLDQIRIYIPQNTECISLWSPFWSLSGVPLLHLFCPVARPTEKRHVFQMVWTHRCRLHHLPINAWFLCRDMTTKERWWCILSPTIVVEPSRHLPLLLLVDCFW